MDYKSKERYGQWTDSRTLATARMKAQLRKIAEVVKIVDNSMIGSVSKD